MKNLLRGVFVLLAVFAFVYYPTFFLVDLYIAINYFYLLYEHLFNAELVNRAEQLPGKLPSRSEFLKTKVRYLMALIDDDCIICRDEPETPVQVLPCQHIFCDACFQEWLKRDQKRCPQCAQILFRTSSRSWEKIVKLVVAHIYVALPLTLLNIAFGPLSRFRIFLDTFTTAPIFGILASIRKSRREFGTEWWSHLQRDGQVANHDELTEVIVENGLYLALIGTWVVYQAVLLESWVVLPEYYLWNVLCAW